MQHTFYVTVANYLYFAGSSHVLQSIILVPLYDTLGEEGVKYILNQTNLTVLFAHPKTVNNYVSYLPEVNVLFKIPPIRKQRKDKVVYEHLMLLWRFRPHYLVFTLCALHHDYHTSPSSPHVS